MAKLTPIQRTAMEWFTAGCTYIECDPRGWKPYKIQTIRSLIKKGYIEITDEGLRGKSLNDPYFVVCGSQVNVLIPVEITIPAVKHFIAHSA